MSPLKKWGFRDIIDAYRGWNVAQNAILGDLGFNGITEHPKIWLAKNIGHYSSLQWQTQDPTVLCADIEDISRSNERSYPFWDFRCNLNPSSGVLL